MEPNVCIGIKNNGDRCSVAVHIEGTRCSIHKKTLARCGPNAIRRKELGYIHKKNTDKIYHDYRIANREAAWENVEGLQQILRHNRNQNILVENMRHMTETYGLEETIRQETVLNGNVDADAPYLEAARYLHEIRLQNRVERWQQRHHLQQQNVMDHLNRFHPDPRRELANIANDRQSVHTEIVVEKVKKIINEVLNIHVPLEYQTETLKTSGEIILECKLSKKAAHQMMAKYCGDEDIYELGEGIYARVLNSVWQYIKASPDSEDLKKILATELEDNIGMCAQGNLTRICNVLAGYIDNINLDTKSRNEQLAEKISALLNIEDVHERRRSAEAIFETMNIPFLEQQEWLNPLIEE